MEHIVRHPDVQQEIERLALDSLHKASCIANERDVALATDQFVAERVASNLANKIAGHEGQREARRAARLVRDNLLTNTEWATPLGRAIGWWVGGPEHNNGGVSRAIAADILAVSRQRTGELIGLKRLDVHVPELGPSPTGITPQGIVDMMQAKYPLTGLHP